MSILKTRKKGKDGAIAIARELSIERKRKRETVRFLPYLSLAYLCTLILRCLGSLTPKFCTTSTCN